MNKEEVFNLLKELNFPKDEFYIVGKVLLKPNILFA